MTEFPEEGNLLTPETITLGWPGSGEGAAISKKTNEWKGQKKNFIDAG